MLVPTPGGKAGEYSLLTAEPIRSSPPALLALLTAIDASYLVRLKARLGHDWAFRVNGRLAATTPGHSELLTQSKAGDEVEIVQRGGQTFAVNAFRPEVFETPGQDTVVIASMDITPLRADVRAGLRGSLLILGTALALALGLALRMARGMSDAIHAISQSAEQLKLGHYVAVKGVRTGDELEDLARAFNITVLGLHERDRLKETLGKYVSRQVAERILEKSELGGEAVQVTLLFSDIRSFTSFSEHMDPRAVLDFLNTYFHDMVESVLANQGVVDKFIGDAIMAVFGAPDPAPDDALRAVRTALDMRRRLIALNASFRQRGMPEIRIGIGIHTGQVVAGNMGHEERREYTVIGDAVNLAARLETMTKELAADILISEDTYRAVESYVDAQPLRKTQVKGRKQEVLVYRLEGMKALPAVEQRRPSANS
jgi:adenylate cyclase